MIFLEWNYNTQTLIKHRRSGECKRCGACCKARIAFRVDSNAPEVRNGGQGTDERDMWFEVDEQNPRRLFGSFVVSDGTPCGSLAGDGSCSKYDERDSICKDWPFHQSLVDAFSGCGYSFEEIISYPFSELEQSND